MLNYLWTGRTFIGGLVGRWRDLSSPTDPAHKRPVSSARANLYERSEIHYDWPALVHEVNTTFIRIITGRMERNCLVLGLQFEF
jgi:hypothetical protein